MLIYVGLVEENIDPKRQGRIKIRVFGVFDQIPTEDLPWSSPFNETDGKSFHVPSIGKLVSVVFIKNNLYSPYYLDAENYNINLKDRLDDMEDDDYVNFSALLYDHRTQIYSNNEELKIDWYFNNISIDKEGINLDLKNNNQKINIGDKKSTQQALFGNHWLDWFDELVTELLNPMSLVGNMGAPIVKTTLDQKLIKYQQIRKTFISNNIFLVDNDKIEEDNDKQKRDYETKTYTHDIDLKFNEQNIIETNIANKISCNSATELNKIKQLTTMDADPEDLEFGLVDCTDQKDAIIIESKKSENKNKSKTSDYKIDKFNNSNYVDKNSTPPEEVSDIINCEDFKNGIDYNSQISTHYKLSDVSTKAIVSSYRLINQKGLCKEQITCNLKELSVNVLDLIKDQYPSMIVTSAFRHGNGSSQHYKGQAADMQFPGKRNADYKEIADWIRNNVPHDQLLLEYKNRGTKKPWIHISYNSDINRNMVLTLFNDSSRTPGGPGLIDLAGSNGIPIT